MSNIIGIDVSKTSLDCAYLRDPDQEKAQRKSCHNEVRCFAARVACIEDQQVIDKTLAHLKKKDGLPSLQDALPETRARPQTSLFG